jgi:hypothetical protein
MKLQQGFTAAKWASRVGLHSTNCEPLMSTLGQKQTSRFEIVMSASSSMDQGGGKPLSNTRARRQELALQQRVAARENQNEKFCPFDRTLGSNIAWLSVELRKPRTIITIIIVIITGAMGMRRSPASGTITALTGRGEVLTRSQLVDDRSAALGFRNLTSPNPSQLPHITAAGMARWSYKASRLANDLIDDFGLPSVLKARTCRVKGLTRKPGRFSIEICTDANQRQDRSHRLKPLEI